MKIKLKYAGTEIDVTHEWFATNMAAAMKEIASSNVLFIMQQAFGEIDYMECEQIWEVLLYIPPITSSEIEKMA